jgi:hypothetical protein
MPFPLDYPIPALHPHPSPSSRPPTLSKTRTHSHPTLTTSAPRPTANSIKTDSETRLEEGGSRVSCWVRLEAGRGISVCMRRRDGAVVLQARQRDSQFANKQTVPCLSSVSGSSGSTASFPADSSGREPGVAPAMMPLSNSATTNRPTLSTISPLHLAALPVGWIVCRSTCKARRLASCTGMMYGAGGTCSGESSAGINVFPRNQRPCSSITRSSTHP